MYASRIAFIYSAHLVDQNLSRALKESVRISVAANVPSTSFCDCKFRSPLIGVTCNVVAA